MIILDTDHISLLERGSSSESHRLQHRLSEINFDEVVTTIITFEEQMRGWMVYLAKARSLNHEVEAYHRLNRHIENYRTIPVLEFDNKAAEEFQRLQKSRIRIGTMDLKIAAIVLVNNATLLSRNLKDFNRVPNTPFSKFLRLLVI
ncbi:MAG: type II toxin-antitoxin system VapC family toxin [Acidobacteriota bacterium]